MPHSRHTCMTTTYACCMDTIQKPYGFAICLLYGIFRAGIWQSQMPAMWQAPGIYMAIPYRCHVDPIEEAYGSGHENHCIVYTPAIWYQYDSYMVYPYIATILMSCSRHMTKPYVCCMHAIIYNICNATHIFPMVLAV